MLRLSRENFSVPSRGTVVFPIAVLASDDAMGCVENAETIEGHRAALLVGRGITSTSGAVPLLGYEVARISRRT